MLDVALDKPSLQGRRDGAREDHHRAGGQGALIAVLSTRLLATHEADIPAGGGEVPIRVSDDWSPGAYVTVTLYRPMDEKAKRMPGRAIGVRGSASISRRARSRWRWSRREKVKSGKHADGARQGRWSGSRRGGAHHGGGRRCRHSQPDALRGAEAGGMVLRPAPARHRDPRLLRPPDRWHARRARLAALGRRRQRRHERAGLSAGGEARWRCSPASSRSAPTARPRSSSQLPDFNGTVRLMAVAWSGEQARLGAHGRDRARCGGADRLGAALPDAGRRGASRARRAQRRRPAGGLQGGGRARDGSRAASRSLARASSARCCWGRRAQARGRSSSSPTRSA